MHSGWECRACTLASCSQPQHPAIHSAPGFTSSPQEPPLCATDPDFDAIVVSEETVPGAHAINKVGSSQHRCGAVPGW